MLKIFPMGGISGVTKNLFLYEYENDIIMVDCGIGFPDEEMLGVDFLIPDTRYLVERLAQGATLQAIFLTHGHDDHIAALGHVLREIDADPPIYASPLTAEFAMTRMLDQGLEKKVQYFNEGSMKAGVFEFETVRVTHSIPDTRHFAIHTPEGVIYHGSDFKFDITPVDGIASDYQKIAEIGREGVLCALIDCLRIERPTPTPSESSIHQALRREFYDVEGKIFVTLMSSSIHRIQQVIDAAEEFGRKVTFIGRSVEQNVRTAADMGILEIPPSIVVDKRDLDGIPDNELCVIIAGSQGQPGSSLVQAVFGTHRYVNINRGDKVVFSSEPIPGSEKNVYRTVNEISAQGIEVIYSDMHTGLHVSGHASEYEQFTLVEMLQPEYVFPVGGEERHRVLFGLKAMEHGYKPSNIVLPKEGKWVEFIGNKMRYSDEVVELRERTVDASGVASVIASDLEARSRLSENGVLVLSMAEQGGVIDRDHMWVDMRGVSLSDEYSRDQLIEVVKSTAVKFVEGSEMKFGEFNRKLERELNKVISKQLGSSPVVVVVVNSL